MEIKEITAVDAKSLIKAHHYAASAEAGMVHIGWFDDEGVLIGASIYNNGYRDMQEGVFGAEYASHVLHHHRLAITPEARSRGFKVSNFIKKCNVILARKGFWAVVTYADLNYVKEGKSNPGHIYNITGAHYTGWSTGGNIFYTTPEGERKNIPSSSSKWGRSWSDRRAEASRRGWTEHRSKGKLRFVYVLGNKSEKVLRRSMLRWEILDYPPTDIAAKYCDPSWFPKQSTRPRRTVQVRASALPS